jgi:hypothetical protein
MQLFIFVNVEATTNAAFQPAPYFNHSKTPKTRLKRNNKDAKLIA